MKKNEKRESEQATGQEDVSEAARTMRQSDDAQERSEASDVVREQQSNQSDEDVRRK